MMDSESPSIRVAGVRTADEAYEFLDAGADLVSPRVDTYEGNPNHFQGAIPAEDALQEFKGFRRKEQICLELMHAIEPEKMKKFLQINQSRTLFVPFYDRAWNKITLEQATDYYPNLVFTNLEMYESTNARHLPNSICSRVPQHGIRAYELEVLEGYPESWEDMRADAQSSYRPTHRDIQLIIRDFDVYLLMDWTCDRILKEAPRLFKGLEGITVVVDHEDTRNRRITHAVSVEPAKLLVSEIDSAFKPSQSKKQETRPSRPAVDIRSRSDFRKILIVSEHPEETREAVNRWYNNYQMDDFAQPSGRSSGVPYVYLATGFSVSDAVEGSDDSVAWTACHDVRYIEKIRDVVEGSGGRVYEWPEGASDVYEALEASHLRN